nr:immunoglobulin light chain junction region [Macaca mulatta]
CQHSHGFPFTF